MRVRRIFPVVAVLVMACSLDMGTALAYTLERSIPANSGSSALADKGIRLYENVEDVNAGHEGWCYPAGSDPKRWWSCTVKSRSFRQQGYNIQTTYAAAVREGETKNIGGRTLTAHKRPPVAGWRPFCAYDRIYMGSNADAYEYKCAYWR